MKNQKNKKSTDEPLKHWRNALRGVWAEPPPEGELKMTTQRVLFRVSDLDLERELKKHGKARRNKMKDELVFSTEKFEEYVRAYYNEKDAERIIEDAKRWTRKCEGLTPEEMLHLGYSCDIAWLVKKSKIRRKRK